jgi:hypothetical protein
MRFVVDTNVAIVANGASRAKSNDGVLEKVPSVLCRIAAVEFLVELLRDHKILLDSGGEIQSEYRRYLSPVGQPGVGDRFYLEVLNSHPDRIERMDIPLAPNGEFVDLPIEVQASAFDRSDRKFAALAKKSDEIVVNSTDSDWLEHFGLLTDKGIKVRFLCGENADTWFD